MIKYIETYFYDERLHCHDVIKLNDVARRQYISGALAAVLWPIFAGYRICFQQQCRSLKVTGKFIVTPPIFNRFSTCLHHVVQNRKICSFCGGRQRVTAENFEIGCFVFSIRHMVGDQYRIFRFSDFRF
jgi:hypothetical protein